ncbi:MAG: TraB/GumN family protein [Candidatus Hydrothermarchaeota archaeon]|nr:TraB/GumN family protein [Candidatus Hydrothermarchaeota archaeon]
MSTKGLKMITVIGTAHISQESVNEVREKILELKPDLVAVELCESRYKGLLEQKDVPIFELIKSKNSFVLIAGIMLSFLQRRLGEEVGVKPGKEMLIAIDTAKELNAQVALIDRDIRITLNRALGKMGFFEKLKVVKEMLTTFALSKEELEKEMQEMKKEGQISGILENFKGISPNIFEVLVKERDAFMAHTLLKLQKNFKNIVAVVGAGHKNGIEKYLSDPEKIPDVNAMLEVPEKRFSIAKLLKFGVPALVVAMFVLAFYKGISLRNPAGLWVLNHAVPTFIAVMLAGGSILSAAVGMAASPLTSLNPMLAAGWFAGLAEMKVRKITVEDVSEMFKITGCMELYRNKAFKVLLVTALANLGSMLGTFISFPTIIFPLIKSILG